MEPCRGRVRKLENVKRGRIQNLDIGHELHPLARGPKQIDILRGQCACHDPYVRRRFVRVQGMRADDGEMLGQSRVFQHLQQRHY